MTYHPGELAVLLFGGADAERVHGDLWAWDGQNWRCVSAEGPPPRTFPTLAYDYRREGLVLFGGNRVLFGTEEDTDTFLNDMWMWDGEEWHAVAGPMPSARAEASMAYDQARQRLVLFGGYRMEAGELVRLGDTWEWDGETWALMSTNGPSPRNGAAMVYDSHREHIVLFGGSGASGETWTWTGTTWTLIEAAVAHGRFNAAMAYDARQQVILRFGGWDGEARVGDTWTYDDTVWENVSTTGPDARNHAAMAYDAKRETLVLFGGHDGPRVFGDTWEWSGEAWLQKHHSDPHARVQNGH
ncbi:MAG: hypothetical protein RhofKO_11430 [Rhodothermales bacterium]